MSEPWYRTVALHELGRGPKTVTLEAGPEERAAIAKTLGLEGLNALKARLTLTPWMDGVELTGRFDAVVEQICAVSLDPFEQALSGQIEVRAVPRGSPNAPEETGGEVDIDLETPDPPDVLEGETNDVAAYVVEHLALEIDPFARKPGVEFEYAPSAEEESPFAVLKKLKDPGD
jgi:uncharacterized metal-binding protein YceD (DUF177 family)